jgi:hypothetical protein
MDTAELQEEEDKAADMILAQGQQIFPIVKNHLVEFSTLTASCTHQGLLNNRTQVNLNTFQGVDELVYIAPFELPDRVINQTDLFHEAFDLPKEERDACLEELFENDALHNTAVEHNWNESYHRGHHHPTRSGDHPL